MWEYFEAIFEDCGDNFNKILEYRRNFGKILKILEKFGSKFH